MTRAEELWEKYTGDGGLDGAHRRVSKSDFLAALKEYGAEVRKRDAEICKGYAEYSSNPMNFAENCADTIEGEPLP